VSYDGAAMRASHPAADAWLTRSYRAGWTL
jgi:hypothetical protein